MKIEDFNALSEEEKAAALATAEANEKQLAELTAERDSFKTENEQLRTQSQQTAAELKATKEVNYTLSRQINLGSNKSDEEMLHELMKEYRK